MWRLSNPVFDVSGKVGLNTACSATEPSQSGMLHVA